MSFGNQTVKTSASQTVTVSNTGTAALSISQASVSGTGYSMTGLTAPMTVAAGASTSFTVSFQPATTGAAAGSVTITSNASPSPLTVGLTGTGVAASTPAISVDAGCGELREPDSKDIGEPNCDGFEHRDGGTIDFAGECERNGLQHDGADGADDGSGRRKHKLHGFVSTDDDGSGCRERNDHEQCEPLTADGWPDGHRCGCIDSSDQCDAEGGELREPDSEDFSKPDGEALEHRDGRSLDLAGECELERVTACQD